MPSASHISRIRNPLPLAPSISVDDRIDLAGFLIHSVVAQLNCATASDPGDFDAVVVEIKRMLVSYLSAIAGF